MDENDIFENKKCLATHNNTSDGNRMTDIKIGKHLKMPSIVNLKIH